MIFRLHRSESQRVSDVCELLVAGEDRATKRKLLGLVRRSAVADLLCASFGSRLEASRCGLLRGGGGTLVTARKNAGDLGVEPAKRDAWALSLGEVDLL